MLKSMEIKSGIVIFLLVKSENFIVSSFLNSWLMKFSWILVKNYYTNKLMSVYSIILLTD